MVIFLHGDDTFRSREKLRELKQKFLREVDPSGTNLVTIDGTSTTADEIWAAVAAQSFLVRKRMVIVEDLGAQKSNAAREGVAALLDRIPEDVILVFWESGSRAGGKQKISPLPRRRGSERGSGSKVRRGGVTSPPAGKDTFFPRLLKEKYVEEFTPLQGRELEAWVRERAKSLGASTDPTAVRNLIAIVGPDLWRMHNELEKLTAAAKSFSPSRVEGEREGEGTITNVLIRELVDAAPSDIPFAFLDAVGRGDCAAAIHCLRELESARVDPHHLLAMLHRQLRLLVMAADLLERGTPTSQLAVELRVHPFVAQKLTQSIRRSLARPSEPWRSGGEGGPRDGAQMEHFCALYPRLLELDRKLKSSRAPWQALMELFVLDAAR